MHAKIGVKAIYDLSATPFFLRGSGYPEGTLFPWVVSDFSLTDAIEAGIVKVPRVPVADDSMTGDQPTYRDLWLRIREDLPRKSYGNDSPENGPLLGGYRWSSPEREVIGGWRWRPVHMQDVVTEPIDVLGQIRTDTSHGCLRHVFPGVLELADHTG